MNSLLYDICFPFNAILYNFPRFLVFETKTGRVLVLAHYCRFSIISSAGLVNVRGNKRFIDGRRRNLTFCGFYGNYFRLFFVFKIDVNYYFVGGCGKNVLWSYSHREGALALATKRRFSNVTYRKIGTL